MTGKKRRRKRELIRGGQIGYSVEQAGEILGICRSSAYAGVASGDIPSVKVAKADAMLIAYFGMKGAS